MTGPSPFHLLWSRQLSTSVAGLALAREANSLLTWVTTGGATVFDRTGRMQFSYPVEAKGCRMAFADNGTLIAIGGASGKLEAFLGGFERQWRRPLSAAITAVAVDPHGEYVAAATAGNRLWLFDQTGRDVHSVETPRPVSYLAFVPERPRLCIASDYGFVGCLDDRGRWIWRDGIVAHIGSLAVPANGERVYLACFSEGLQAYDAAGKRIPRTPSEEAVRLAATTMDGDRLLTVGESGRLTLAKATGETVGSLTANLFPAAVVFGALGRFVAAGFSDGVISAYRFDGE